MPYDPYDDPEIRAGTGNKDFPLTVKWKIFGDRVRGVIVDIDRWDPPARSNKPDEKPKPILKYKIGDAVVSQEGRQARVEYAEVLAGAANLEGQLLTLKPRIGDEIDITFASESKGSGAFATKIFKIEVTTPTGVKMDQEEPFPAQPQPAQPEPLRVVGGGGGDDLFARG